jgi:PAS domain-containing protein
VEDDGGGIDFPRLRAAAVRKGFLAPDQAATVTESDLLDLLFRPGFTSVAVPTGVSGRGVGLDVVKTAVTRLGGTVEIATQPGKGTRFDLRLPLATAILHTLMVGVGVEVFAIPSESSGATRALARCSATTPQNWSARFTLTLSFRFSLAKDKTGREIGYVVIVNDITLRKRAETNLLREKTLSDTIINSLPGVFGLLGEDGCVLRWNQTLERVTGYSPDELMEMHSLDLCAGADREKLAVRFQQALNEGLSASAQRQRVPRNGAWPGNGATDHPPSRRSAMGGSGGRKGSDVFLHALTRDGRDWQREAAVPP